MLTIQKFDNLLKTEVNNTRDGMYRRQALFCVYLDKFSQSIGDIRDNLKRLYGADYDSARGYLNKELKTAEKVLTDTGLHSIISSGEEASDIITAAADYMHKNQLNYRTLFTAKSGDKKTRAEQIQDFVNKLTYAEAVQVNKSIEARLDYLQKAEAEAEAEKRRKEAEAEAKRIQKAEAQAEKQKQKQEKLTERLDKVLVQLAKLQGASVAEVLESIEVIEAEAV